MLSLKNGKEAIFEFLKIKTPDLFTKVSKYLNQPEQAAASQPNPYNQMDLYLLQCSLLKKFAEENK